MGGEDERMETLNGLLVLDKSGGMTSRAALDRAQRWFPRRTRLGHTGTLDPLATGVLVLCLGTATRLAEYVQRMGKTYRTRLRLGVRSDTDDADGTVTSVENARMPGREEIAGAVKAFLGPIEQTPPAFSAVKVTGRRAYDLARRGEDMALAAKIVQVYGIDVLGYEPPFLDLEVRCGKGTYVRSLGRDLGERLGCGALVQTLRRLRVGPFSADNAVSLDASADEARAKLRPVEEAVAELPVVTLDDAELKRLRQGQGVPLAQCDAGEVAVFDGRKRLVAVAAYDADKRLLWPAKVLA
jgi:tRNA pseudouridine55 synthase